MVDLGDRYTDKQIRDIERTISHLYSQAEKDIAQKLKDFTEKSEKEEQILLKRVADGKMTQDAFDKWKQTKVFQGKQWNDKMKQMADVLANTNTVANNIVNGKQIGVFAMNGNYAAYQFESGAGVNLGFTLYDEKTVSNLIKDNPNILPFKKLDKKKDEKWNFKNIRSQVTQGIIQGESIDKIAKRLSEVVPNRNERQMVLHARTAMNAAQNSGRMERYKDAERLGIKFKKVWVATHDGRTRDTHIELDGQAVNPDEDFKVEGMTIRFPGDPYADPALVYNCRCTMTTELVDYPRNYAQDIDSDMTYSEWERSKKSAGATQNTVHKVVDGKDISNTWKRRADKFDFEIEDVINAQGFDGLPRVVSAEEFDELVKQANNGDGFIAQRTYSAPDQETLDAYRDQLYNGKWYVDCSTGGAQYGQGMYCAADYNGELSTGIKMEMKHYKDLGESRYETYFDAGEARQRKFAMAEKEGDAIIARGGTNEEARAKYESILNIPDKEWAEKYSPELLPTKGVSYIETLTLDPSAKVIIYSDAEELYKEYRNKFNYEALTTRAMNEVLDSMDLSKRERLDVITMRNLYNTGTTKSAFDRLEKLQEKYPNVNMIDINAKVEDLYKEYTKDRIDNIGSYVASIGYDAINAEGHGESSSYTVILNRTKCIIKGE